jgi:hypothetical protein
MILSSKKQFVPKYLDGTKLHSIRKGNRWREGMSIQFFQDTRTVNMKKFMEDKMVEGVQDIFMTFIQSRFEITVDHDTYLYWPEQEKLAKNDGFKTVEDMRLFFFPIGCEHAYWSGQIIHWTNLKY